MNVFIDLLRNTWQLGYFAFILCLRSLWAETLLQYFLFKPKYRMTDKMNELVKALDMFFQVEKKYGNDNMWHESMQVFPL